MDSHVTIGESAAGWLAAITLRLPGGRTNEGPALTSQANKGCARQGSSAQVLAPHPYLIPIKSLNCNPWKENTVSENTANSPYKDEITTEAKVLAKEVVNFLNQFGSTSHGGSVEFHIDAWTKRVTVTVNLSQDLHRINAGPVKPVRQ